MQTQRRQKLISTSSNVSHSAASCICCLHELTTYVYYQCMHFVCLNCAIKMRVLCDKKDCPVCRQDSPSVLCTKAQLDDTNKSEFEALIGRGSRAPSYLESGVSSSERLDVGIYFDASNHQVREEYTEILANKCDVCCAENDERKASDEPFATFKELDSHMRKAHKRFFCELCLTNLKLFPYERKHYSREELALHKRNGDKDDYSFRGHPLCKFVKICLLGFTYKKKIFKMLV
jgi:hypothetical protein